MTTAPPTSTKRLHLLQVYRGVAALLVLVYHTGYTQSQDKLGYTLGGELLSFGYSGVDFFFVLSGFIIFYTQYAYLGQPDALKSYYLKRFVRVFPFYWVINTVLVALFLIVPGAGRPSQMNPWGILASYLLLPDPWHRPVIIVAWTLVYEMLFYLLFGLAVVLPTRQSRWVFGGLVSAAAGIYLLQLVLLVQGRPYPFVIPYPIDFLLSRHTLEFALGALSAYLVIHRKIGRPLVWIGVGAALYLAFGLTEPYWSAIFARNHRVFAYGVPSFILISGSAMLELQRRVPVNRVLGLIGDASYALYLVHSIIISIALEVYLRIVRHYLALPPAVLVLAIMAAATLISCAVYYWLERPLIAYGHARVRQWTAQPAAAGD